MARTKTPDTEQASEPHCDVLVYVATGGAIKAIWNALPPDPRGTEASGFLMVPEQPDHRMEPGLSFVPGDKWARVKDSTSYIAGHKEGLLKPAAGHRGDLEGEWARLGANGIASMLDQSFDVVTVRRLQAMETGADDPRLEVSELIDARLDRLKVKAVKEDKRRRTERHRTRPRMPL